jgi:fumarate reductase flavoprotein subunit
MVISVLIKEKEAMKKPFVRLALCILLVLIVFTGCSHSQRNRELRVNDGTFRATAQGRNGDLTVETVFSRNRIASITVVAHNESSNFAKIPVQRIPSEIVQYQSLAVDSVAGATFTSRAIVSAVMDTVQQAGGDVQTLFTAIPRSGPNRPVTITTDIVVVGSGIGGLSAAVQAKLSAPNKKVLLIEKLGLFGGTTSTSEGEIFGANNAIMNEWYASPDNWPPTTTYPNIDRPYISGWQDSVQRFYNWQKSLTWGPNDADYDVLWFNSNLSKNTIEWLQGMGVTFRTEPHATYRRYVPSRSLREEHLFGYGITNVMVDYGERIGVEFMIETAAVSLRGNSGRVSGVNAKDRTGGDITINAEIVILATGGFHYSEEKMREWLPLIYAAPRTTAGSIGSTGEGIQMALDIGAKHDPDDHMIGSLLVAAPTRAKGVMVVPPGIRIADEDSYVHNYTSAMGRAGFSYAYIISDANNAQGAEEAVAAGNAVKADTIAGLAAAINSSLTRPSNRSAQGKPTTMTATDLERTITRYNYVAANPIYRNNSFTNHIAEQVDMDFGKTSAHLQQLNTPPYYAWLVEGYYVVGTRGGLDIDQYGRVKDNSGSIIPGLFAVGEMTNNKSLPRHYGGSGGSLYANANLARRAGHYAATGSDGPQTFGPRPTPDWPPAGETGWPGEYWPGGADFNKN